MTETERMECASWCDRQAAAATAAQDSLAAIIWRARAACTRAGKILETRRGDWLTEWERSRDPA
jgi:hypothetical protein